MTQPVNFELAKLLKEKGFDKPTHAFFVINENGGYGEVGELIIDPNNNYPALDDNNLFDTLASAPTIAEVIMWLYEKHGIWIMVDCNSKESWSPILVNIEDGNYKVHPSYVSQEFIEKNNRLFNSPTKAYEAAIEHVLENLI